MKPYLTFTATVFLLTLAAPGAQAGLFGKDKKDATPDAPAATQGVAPAAGFTNMPPAQDEQSSFKPATQAEIQAMLRADPLTQSAFFTNQYDHDPMNAQLGLYLSNALRALGRTAEAADAAHRVLLFAPDNIDVLLAAARAHIADNNAFYAIDSLQHAIQLKPKDWQAHSLLGVAYDQVKRPADAQAEWATALQLSPNNPSVLTNQAMSKAEKGDFAGAEPLLRTAVAQTGATLQMRQNLALVLGLEGKMGEAEQLLRRDLPPDQADANLAWLQQALQSRTASAAATPGARSWDSVKTSGS